jgi:hypothetical protein
MKNKPEVHRVIAQIEAPTSRNPAGRVSFGFYTVAKGLLTMTDADGIPMRNTSGDLYTHKLGKGENPASMACVMTKEVRAAVHGYSVVSGPKREPLVYPKTGWR